jgi:L-galactose dehydrogenase
MEYRPLGNTGLQVSVIGYGASSLGGVFGDIDESTGINAVHRSFDLGVNFVDVSPYYGLTVAETVLGKALQGIPRDSYVLATKVGRYGNDEFDFSARRVIASVDESLARLGVDHIDLIQCHDIEFGDLDQVINETVPALRDLATTGKVRFVGVTGYPLGGLDKVTAAVPVDTILTYCRYNLQDTSLARWLPTFHQRGVGVINASVLAMGALTNRGAPPWHPAPADVLEACAKAAKLCTDRGTDIAKVGLQFALARTDVASTLVGSADPGNMERNIAWAQEPLDPELLADVQAVLAPAHDVTWPTGRPENRDSDDLHPQER